jgi:DNA-binding NarL/FixJ family response regulator
MIRLIIVLRRKQDLQYAILTLNSQADFSVIGLGSESYQALKLAEEEQPDIAIIDYHLDTANGLEIIPIMKRKCSSTRIILISPYDDESRALDAMKRGVSGYLLQRSDMDILIGTIQMVQSGGRYISHRIVARVFRTLPELLMCRKFYRELGLAGRKILSGDDWNIAALTLSQRQIVGFLNQGRSTKEIAETLGLKMGTVRNYISDLVRKTGSHTRSQMVNQILHNTGKA